MSEQESYTCPECGMTSYHPEDIRNEYCGNCHKPKWQILYEYACFFEDKMGLKLLTREEEIEWPAGTRLRKIKSDPEDAHQDGAMCTAVGALGPVPDNLRAEMMLEMQKHGIDEEVLFFYFVIWDDIPGIPVGITEHRLEKVGR